MSDTEILIREKRDDDRGWLTEKLESGWGSVRMVTNGKLFDVRDQDGLIAEIGGEPAGMLMYHVDGGECEIRLLESFRPNIGVGGRLIRAVIDMARQSGCRRLWVVTTNDNTRAPVLPEERFLPACAPRQRAGGIAQTEAGKTGNRDGRHSAARRDRTEHGAGLNQGERLEPADGMADCPHQSARTGLRPRLLRILLPHPSLIPLLELKIPPPNAKAAFKP